MLPRNLNAQKLNELISVAQFKRPATVWIRNGTVLNVYTGELLKQNVAIMEDRIAYIGEKEPLVDDKTKTIDAMHNILVPGYIEPHAHSFQIYNPLSFSEFAIRHGATTLLHDNLPFFLNMEQSKMELLFEAMWNLPVKNFWWGRIDPQVHDGDLDSAFDIERVERVLSHPLVLQAGEFTDWKRLLNGSQDLLNRVWQAKRMNKRIETHNPGSSSYTLNSVAAAGITACHESISSEDVLCRIRLGYYTALRHSSIRPDLPQIIKDLLHSRHIAWDKMFFTTDGSPPFYLENGLIDFCIREAIQAGLEPIWAYRMASHHVAVYYRIDHEVGGISPGRLADIVFLEDLRDPTPIDVMADGEVVVQNSKIVRPWLDFDWDKFEIQYRSTISQNVRADWFRLPNPFSGLDRVKLPVIEYLNSVITRCSYKEFALTNGHANLQNSSGIMYCAMLNRHGKWISNGLVQGLGEVDALATTYSLSGDLIILGKDKEQMALAANRVLQMGGGISLYNNGSVFYELSLPLIGLMSKDNVDNLIRDTSRFVEIMTESGYRYDDPIYSLLFLSATHLPSVRITPQGIYDVRKREVFISSIPLP